MTNFLFPILNLFTMALISFQPVMAQEIEPEFKEGAITSYEVEVPQELISNNFDLRLKVFNLEFPLIRDKREESKYLALVTPPLGVVAGKFPTAIMSIPKTKVDPAEVPKPFKYKMITVKTRANVLTDEVLNAPEMNVLPTDQKTVSRIAQEDAEQKEILKTISNDQFWNDRFILPVSNEITSQFGLFRIYSKHLRRRTHWGVDFKTPLGTPVKASGRGRVVLTKELYFPGKTIMIDHGMGLYTGYSHLDSMNVKIGDVVEIGQVIGRSGRSGKVTGLHLHWFGVNARVKFDPLSLLNISQSKNEVTANRDQSWTLEDK